MFVQFRKNREVDDNFVLHQLNMPKMSARGDILLNFVKVVGGELYNRHPALHWEVGRHFGVWNWEHSMLLTFHVFKWETRSLFIFSITKSTSSQCSAESLRCINLPHCGTRTRVSCVSWEILQPGAPSVTLSRHSLGQQSKHFLKKYLIFLILKRRISYKLR